MVALVVAQAAVQRAVAHERLVARAAAPRVVLMELPSLLARQARSTGEAAEALWEAAAVPRTQNRV